jgi:hypothetical protein
VLTRGFEQEVRRLALEKQQTPDRSIFCQAAGEDVDLRPEAAC